ncbi:hypothetical protein Avbf_03067 [Armadillidium vulgare]|nr:hypothetical protein Avbf_03067 [Armadillidium vulgare]
MLIPISIPAINQFLYLYLYITWSKISYPSYLILHLHINLPLIIEFLPLSSLSNIITLPHCHI